MISPFTAFIPLSSAIFFFPSSSDSASLLLAVATFAVGFIMRPLGSLLLGQYADRHGRKAALTLIMGLMALGVMMVAFTPVYAQIGLWAPLLLVTGRMLQGFSAGGEVGAATSWLMEAGDKSQRGVRVSWQMASQGGAALTGAALGALLTHTLSSEALYAWGWRIPFILGLAIMPVGIYIRRHLHEPPVTQAARQENPARLIWRAHRRKLLLGILLVMKSTTTFYLIVYYMPAYMVNTLHQPAAASYWISIIAALLTLMVPFFRRQARGQAAAAQTDPARLRARIDAADLAYFCRPAPGRVDAAGAAAYRGRPGAGQYQRGGLLAFDS
ncbi:MFS transporter [Pantoea tagorei]